MTPKNSGNRFSRELALFHPLIAANIDGYTSRNSRISGPIRNRRNFTAKIV
jgi:hypothetical protein